MTRHLTNMKPINLIFILSIILFATACSAAQPKNVTKDENFVLVYKTPGWGCCSDWSNYLEDKGFTVEQIETTTLDQIKEQNNIPALLESCHTAIVDGYIIEGHVPAAEIRRLLQEKPEIIGIGVAGMPIGSPGMEIEGMESEPFDVLAFTKSGDLFVYASYPWKSTHHVCLIGEIIIKDPTEWIVVSNYKTAFASSTHVLNLLTPSNISSLPYEQKPSRI